MSDKMKEFCQQLLRHAQFKSQRDFLTGSVVEIREQVNVLKIIDLKLLTLTDVDNMHYLTHCYAFPLCQSVPEMYTGKVVRICSIGRHPGYTKLYNEDDNMEFTFSEIRFLYQKIHMDQPGRAIQ